MNIHFHDPVTNEKMMLELDVLPRKDDVVEIGVKRFTVWRTVHRIVENPIEIKHVEGVPVACRPNNPYSQKFYCEGQFSAKDTKTPA